MSLGQAARPEIAFVKDEQRNTQEAKRIATSISPDKPNPGVTHMFDISEVANHQHRVTDRRGRHREYHSIAAAIVFASLALGATAADRTRTPAAAPPAYSYGLGDNQNSLYFVLMFRDRPDDVLTTWSQAVEMYKELYHVTNGTHLVGVTTGWESWKRDYPTYEEDTAPPFAHSFSKFRQFNRDIRAYNGDAGAYIGSEVAGPVKDALDAVPGKDKSLDASGKWKFSEAFPGLAGWYSLSLRNRIDDGDDWRSQQSNVANFGLNFVAFDDTLMNRPQAQANESTALGGPITTAAQERAAGVEEIDHLWKTYGISVYTEFDVPEFIGHGVGVWSAANLPNSDYLNKYGSSTIFLHRGMRQNDQGSISGLAWGSEYGNNYRFYSYGSFHLDTVSGSIYPIADLRSIFYRYTVQYLYMQKYRPVSFKDTATYLRVNFSGDLVSTAYKSGGDYTLTQGPVILASKGDRFVPQVGAGCKIFAYSANGSIRSWTLPPTWRGIRSIDRYMLSMTSPPRRVDELPVANKKVTLDMRPETAYLLVPAGDSVTPVVVGFYGKAGDVLGTYGGIKWSAGSSAIRVEKAGAAGGFASNSAYIDSRATSQTVAIGMPRRILHSFRVGNRGGTGSLLIRSSNPQNPEVTLTALPPAGQTRLLETNWQHPETGSVSLVVRDGAGVDHVLFDYLTYSTHLTAAR